MEFDGVVQVLVALGFVVFWLLGSGQKKKPGARPMPRSIDATNPATGTIDTERLIREALGLAEPEPEHEPARRVALVEEAPAVEPYRLEEQSLMVGSSTDEQERRHVAFHDRYIERHPAVARKRGAGSRRRRFDGPSVREAIVWREILGPPKGLEMGPPKGLE